MGTPDQKKSLGGKQGLLAVVVIVGALLVQKFTGIDLLGSDPQAPGGTASEVRTQDSSQSSPQIPAEQTKGATAAKDSQGAGAGVDFVYQQFKAQRSSVWVTTGGKVVKLLADDNHEPRHQQFLLELDKARDFTVKVAHNIDDAPYIPLEEGDTIQIQGRYEFNELGGVIHFTHRADRPTTRKPGGWIDHKGQRYQ